MNETRTQRVVIVGAGHAGGRVALQLRASGFLGEIRLIGEEPELPYERPPLSKDFLMSAGRERHVPIAAEDCWKQLNVLFSLGTKALSLRPSQRTIQLSDGNDLQYDQLVVATGATPRELSVPGAQGPSILSLRTVADASALRDSLEGGARRLAIIGGGVIGLEVAAAARQKGLEVTVIEAADRLMARVVPRPISSWIASLHRARGVRVCLGTEVRSIEPTARGELRILTRTALDENVVFETDLVLVAIGVSPCTEWLQSSGLALAQGLVVDSHCRSPSDARCYGVGDVASTWHLRYGRPLRQETWRNAENQARAVAEIICGRSEPYVETPWMWSDQYDSNIQVLGLPAAADSYVIRGEPETNRFCWMGLHGNTLVGAALVNYARERRRLETIINAGSSVDPATLSEARLIHGAVNA